jgi:hypothetical protein
MIIQFHSLSRFIGRVFIQAKLQRKKYILENALTIEGLHSNAAKVGFQMAEMNCSK